MPSPLNGRLFKINYRYRMLKTVDNKLADFIEDNIPVAELRKAGLFPKRMRSTDYETIAARVCAWFGFESIYEYEPPSEMIEVEGANVIVGKYADRITDAGALERGDSFHLDICQSSFVCPICECPQEAKDSNKVNFTQKCRGCKRPLNIISCPFTGNLTVTEKK